MPHRASRSLSSRVALTLLALCGCAADQPSVATSTPEAESSDGSVQPEPERVDAAVRESGAPTVGESTDDAARDVSISDASPSTDADHTSVATAELALDWDFAKDCQIAGVAVGGAHACAFTTRGHVYCWGDDYSLQLGASANERCSYGMAEYPCSDSPLPVAGVHDVVALALSNSDSCALDRAGQVRCWGSSQSRIFGDGSRCVARGSSPAPGNLTCSPVPTVVAGVAGAISLGAWGTQCAAQRDGKVMCWVAHMGPVPTAVPDVTQAAQTDYQCARTSAGKVQCWWCNDLGQRGDGTLAAAQQVGVASNCQLTTSTVDWQGKAVDIASGYDHACLVDESGSVACWGDAHGGSLGVPAKELPICNYDAPCATRPLPMPGVQDAVQVSAGYGFSCVLRAQGDVSCTTQAGPLARVKLPDRAVQIAARYGDACAVIQGGRVFCWQPGGPEALREVVFCAPGP